MWPKSSAASASDAASATSSPSRSGILTSGPPRACASVIQERLLGSKAMTAHAAIPLRIARRLRILFIGKLRRGSLVERAPFDAAVPRAQRIAWIRKERGHAPEHLSVALAPVCPLSAARYLRAGSSRVKEGSGLRDLCKPDCGSMPSSLRTRLPISQEGPNHECQSRSTTNAPVRSRGQGRRRTSIPRG
jgi:hypothetical protein